MKRKLAGVTVLLAALVVAGCATAQRGAMIQANARIAEGDYVEGLKRLSDAESYVPPTPELQAEIVYLRARCYEGLGRTPDAVGALKYLVDKFTGTSYAYQAREKLRQMEERGPERKAEK